MSTDSVISLAEDRFARFAAIKWWDQARLARARVLVVGAGALGNEVIKDLALLGVGALLIVDMDRIEASNLCRSVLFRPGDEGRPKAEVAARAARELYPDLRAEARVGNVLADLGLGFVRWADAIVGAVDNREARVFINRAAAQTGRAWIDGGIDVLSGVVRGFAPPASACYECTMGRADWDLIAKRRSCSLLARKAFAEGGAPTTPTTASIIGAMQAQEVVKRLHGLESLTGSGFVFEGLAHSSYAVSYPISPDCPWHEPPPAIEPVVEWSSDTPLADIWRAAERRLGGPPDAIDLSRELVEALECPDCPPCQRAERVLAPVDRIDDSQAVCPRCGAERVPRFVHSLVPASGLLDLTSRQLGLPPWDVLWPRRGEATVGYELTGDRPAGAIWAEASG